MSEAAAIDAELRELRAFVSAETRHAPTVQAVNELRVRVARALGHSDVWCVAHCIDAEHELCDCGCHFTSPVASGGTT